MLRSAKWNDPNRRRARRWALGLAAVTCALATSAAAHAQSLYFHRYLVCDEQPHPAPVHPVVRDGDELSPLTRRRAPSTLPIAPLINIDVAVAQPIPVRKASPRATPELPTRWASSSDYRCIGFPRGKAGILRVVSAPLGTRWYGHGRSESWRQDNIRAAGAFDAREAIPWLRRTLKRPVPEGLEGYRRHEIERVKLAAARALADLGDTASAPLVLDWLRELERTAGSVFWKDALDSLPRLDPALAQAYATEVAGRSAAPDRPSEDHHAKLWAVLPLIVDPSSDSVAALRALSPPLERVRRDIQRTLLCQVLAARVRAGDDELVADLRTDVGAKDLRTARAVTCYSALMPELYPGRDPDEVDLLTHRHRYESILRLIDRMAEQERAGHQDPRFATAGAQLRRWLQSRSTTPTISGGKRHRDFSPQTRALHLVALAALGDREAREAIDRTIADPADDELAPWLGAQWLLELDLPRAADRAAERLRLASVQLTRRYTSKSWPHRGHQIVTEHVQIIDALAARGDPRFALGLLDRSRFAREAALQHLARRRPPEACGIVGDAARAAEAEAVQDAFWALSVLGPACRPTMAGLAADPSQPDHVRGMAIESLAMMRDAGAAELALDRGKRDPLRQSKRRARVILRSRD
ncbi:MAG: hypothetical protein JRI23_00965 [Deltaproteobacteria bacterium]|nr:hypothetical protein [Deltaproteobacteria bacterium]MBW2530024.1 hypothetical protein [Deltaproteobacteria bacterium]